MNRSSRSIRIAATLALACAAAHASDIRTSTSFTPIDEAPAAMVAADDQTLVLVYELPLRVITRRPNAAGELVEHASLTLQGNRFTKLAKGDLTGDGRPDLALYALQERLIHILINQGDGTFAPAPKSPYPTPTSASNDPAFAIADADGDGTNELFISAGGIFRYPNLGHGDLGFPALIAPGVGGNEMLVGDFKGAGQNQIVVISNTNIRLLEKNGDIYEPTLSSGTTRAYFRLAPGEILPDGRRTILAAEAGPRLHILAYRESSNLFLTTTIHGGSAQLLNPTDVTFSDLNADGKADLLLADAQAITLRPILSDPDAQDGYRVDPAAGYFYGLHAVASIDINADGFNDTVYATTDPPGLFALINDPDHVFRTYGAAGTKFEPLYGFWPINAPGEPLSFFVPRFYSGSQTQANQRATVLPDGPGHAIQTTDFEGPTAAPTHTRWIVADLDNDGRPDLIEIRRITTLQLTSPRPHALRYHRALPDGTYADPIESHFTAYTNLSTPVVADLNNDGVDDVAVMDAFGRVFIFLGNADATIAPPIEFQLVPEPDISQPANGALMAADLDNDGFLDLVGANRLPQGSAVYIAYGLGDAQFETPVSMPAPPSAGGQISPAQAVGDLNDDAVLDIAITGSGQSAVYLSTGPRTYAPFQTVSSANNPGVLFITDFTADGRNELVLTYRGFTEVIRFTEGQPQPDPARFLTPTAVQAIHFEDLTDNGLPDMLIASTQGLSIIYNRTQSPCPADINNDGQLNFFDVAAYLNLFNAGDPAADLNNDGQLNFFDLSAYIGLFNEGCP